MFRRIEMIGEYKADGKENFYAYKYGLMAGGDKEVIDAWIYQLRGPSRSIPSNAKFYFTEKGWKEVGRNVVKACQRVGQEYRIIKVKEKSVNVVWRDKHTEYEVACQPKRKRS